MPLNPAAARWLFFDLGYTLINEDAAAAERLRQLSRALQTRGIHAPPADIRAALDAAAARFDPNPFGNAIRAFTQDDDIIQFARSSGRYPKELETPYPQARALLERLSQRYNLGVIANQPPGTAERLASYGLAYYFAVCVSSGEAGVSKPDPAIFRLALTAADCAPADAVMIGDRLDNDIRPAKALGFAAVRILQGPGRLQHPRSATETPDATAADLDALATLF